MELQQFPPGLKKDWLAITAEILGFPLSWTQRPSLLYTDPQLYPFRFSSRTVAEHRRVDSVLTRDGNIFKMLKVQAVKYVQDEPNSTWKRHSIGEVRTITMTISKLPLISKARFDLRFGHTTWGPWASWAWYFFMWIFCFAFMIIWSVSYPMINLVWKEKPSSNLSLRSGYPLLPTFVTRGARSP